VCCYGLGLVSTFIEWQTNGSWEKTCYSRASDISKNAACFCDERHLWAVYVKPGISTCPCCPLETMGVPFLVTDVIRASKQVVTSLLSGVYCQSVVDEAVGYFP